MLNTETRKSVSKKIQDPQVTKPSAEAIALLMEQHREVESLFAEIEGSGAKAYQSKKKLYETLSEKLQLHMKLEEKIFYPVAKEIDDDAILEALEEHQNVKTMLRKISSIEASDETFGAKIKVLKELVEHHVKEEEEELFPECEKAIAEEELAILGQQMAEVVQKDSASQH